MEPVCGFNNLTTIEDLGDHLVDNICLRLSLKSHGRLKCVNKNFNARLSDPWFVSKYVSKLVSFLHCSYDVQSRSLFCIPLHLPHGDEGFSRLLFRNCGIITSHGGLILCNFYRNTEWLFVLNPITKNYQFLYDDLARWFLPTTNSGKSNTRIGLAVDPITSSLHRFTLVSLIATVWDNGTDIEFQVFSSHDSTWKKVKETLHCQLTANISGVNESVYMNGRLHWLRTCGDIIAFDVIKMQSWMINAPNDVNFVFNCKRSWFGVKEGHLTLALATKDQIQIWVLIDYKNGVWELETSISMTVIIDDEELWNPIFVDGDKVFVQQRGSGSVGKISEYDMKLKEWNRIGTVPGYKPVVKRSKNFRNFFRFEPCLAKVEGLEYVFDPTTKDDEDKLPITVYDANIIYDLTELFATAFT